MELISSYQILFKQKAAQCLLSHESPFYRLMWDSLKHVELTDENRLEFLTVEFDLDSNGLYQKEGKWTSLSEGNIQIIAYNWKKGKKSVLVMLVFQPIC